MKKFRILIGVICSVFVVALVGINLYMHRVQSGSAGKEYRVSVNRVEKDIEDYERSVGSVPSDLDVLVKHSGKNSYPGILALCSIIPEEASEQEMAAFLQGSEEPYVIVTTKQAYYRISYETVNRTARSLIWLVNGVLSALFLTCMGILFYVRNNILKPFTNFSSMPYELSKGNMTMPLTENRNRFFGRFLWGMELLREHIEERKEKELALQREKKMLLLSLSHDVKTPLSAIKLYAKALERNLYKDEAKRAEIIENIGHKTEEIENYIVEIVKASNEDFLHFEVQNREFYIGDVLERIRAYYADKMELNQIRFEMGKYSNCMVYADEERVTEVIQNIIENAIKYGDGKKISLATEHDDEAYTISIRSTGCELEAKELPHIFDSFYRGSNAGTKPGSGLGLYICRELVHQMEGEITASMVQEEDVTVLVMRVSLRMA